MGKKRYTADSSYESDEFTGYNPGSDDSFGSSGFTGNSEPEFGEDERWYREDVKKHNDSVGTIYSMLGGLVGVLIASVLYMLIFKGMRSTTPTFSNIFLVGMMCSFFSVCSYLGIGLYTRSRIERVLVNSKCIPVMLLAFACMFAIGAGLQYVYSLDYSSADVVTGGQADDYVFLIDDSGSMGGSDPDKLRIDAVAQVLDGVRNNNRVAFMLFDQYVFYSEGLSQKDYPTAGKIKELKENCRTLYATDFSKAIDTALNLEGVRDKDRVSEIVLMTDAVVYDTDVIDVQGIVNTCKEYNIKFSFVRLGDSANSVLFDSFIEIADATGGMYIEVDDAAKLVEAYATIAGGFSNDDRNIIGERKGPSRNNMLLTLFRILAWAVIGFGYAVFLKLWLRDDLHKLQIPLNVGTGALIGILTEVFGRLTQDTLIFEVDGVILAIPLMCYVILSYKTVKVSVKGRDDEDDYGGSVFRGSTGSLSGKRQEKTGDLGSRGETRRSTSSSGSHGRDTTDSSDIFHM